MEYSIPFVCVFGVVTVFLSLLAIVLLSGLMSRILRAMGKPEQSALSASPAPVQPTHDPAVIAAMMAALADDSGLDLKNVRLRIEKATE